MIESQKETLANQPLIEENQQFLPLLPLKNVVMLPKSIIPIIVGRPSSVKAVETALKKDKTIFITASAQWSWVADKYILQK